MCQGSKGTSSVQQTGKINASRKERNIFRTIDRKDKCVKEGKEHLPYSRPERCVKEGKEHLPTTDRKDKCVKEGKEHLP